MKTCKKAQYDFYIIAFNYDDGGIVFAAAVGSCAYSYIHSSKKSGIAEINL